MRAFKILFFTICFTFFFGCNDDEGNNETIEDPTPEASVDVTLTLTNNQVLNFEMDDANFIFACGAEGGVDNLGHWFIQGPEIMNGNETIEIRFLNLILDDISSMNPPYNYSGAPQTGESFNRILRNGIAYNILSIDYSILEYNVIDSNFETYLAEVTGSFSIEIESPGGDQENILITFSPMLQTDYGGGC